MGYNDSRGSWHLRSLDLFDTETDSPDPLDARIISAAHIAVDGSGVTEPEKRLWLVQPERDIPPGAQAIHGITTEHAAENGRYRALAVEEIAERVVSSTELGVPLVGHNVVYDLTVLACELARLGLASLSDRLAGEPVAPVLDTLVIDWHIGGRPAATRRLWECCQHYQVRLDGAHDAAYDAFAAGRVLYRIASLHPEIAAMSPMELHTAQITWAQERAAAVQARLRSQGSAREVDGSWPLRPPAAVAS